MLLASSQTYARLFRPWDAVGEEKQQFINTCSESNPMISKSDSNIEIDSELKVKLESEKHASAFEKLRKVRNNCRSAPSKSSKHIQQDSTISTTTDDASDFTDQQIEDLNSRLRSEESPLPKSRKTNSDCHKSISREECISSNASHVGSHGSTLPLNHPCYSKLLTSSPDPTPYSFEGYLNHQTRYPADFLSQAELAQSLGIPPTDPLLLESFAQGYAMEMEYARIIHQENQNKLLNARKQRPKKYRCPHCDVGFSNNGQLKGHIRIHTGERPFKCDDKNCGKTFTRNEELTRHRRIHSGLRPYPCPTCGKKFGRRDHLKKHTRTHVVQAERMMPMFVPLTAMGPLGGYPYVYGY